MNSDVLAEGVWISPEVHQAEGVLSARLDISIGEAVVTLRSISDHADTPLTEIARHILAGTQLAF